MPRRQAKKAPISRSDAAPPNRNRSVLPIAPGTEAIKDKDLYEPTGYLHPFVRILNSFWSTKSASGPAVSHQLSGREMVADIRGSNSRGRLKIPATLMGCRLGAAVAPANRENTHPRSCIG
jgi:hypothetical protein